MTLLVLELRVPEQASGDNASLWQELKDLSPKFFPYVLSFLVLGQSWLAKVRVRMASEHVTRTYAVAWLANLFFITCVPFSTMLVGRYGDVPVAICVYAGNMGMNGVTALIMLLSMREAHREGEPERLAGVLVLIISSALGVLRPAIRAMGAASQRGAGLFADGARGAAEQKTGLSRIGWRRSLLSRCGRSPRR